MKPEYLDLQSADGSQINIDALYNTLYQIAPSCFTEAKGADGKIRKAINFDVLRQLLGDAAADTGDEFYQFTWPGKAEARREAARPIKKTLRPVKEDSVNWDTTQNLYIEGDNLEVLKLLQKSYLGKVKMIYIDPPYNTGNDFVYKDNFSQSTEDYAEASGDVDSLGNRYRRNTDSNGRFHSDWCSMMYSRLLISRTLLREDGVIFISIDESEIENLTKICNEIFGDSNFVAQLVWQNKKGGGNDSQYIAVEHEYILIYANNIDELGAFYQKYDEKYLSRYKEEDAKGKYFWDTFKRKSGKQYYPIECPDGTILQFDDDGNPISWLRSRETFEKDLASGEIRIVKLNKGWSVQFKQRMPEGKKPRSIFETHEILSDKGTTSTGSDDVYGYFKKDVFSNPKPIKLISFLMEFGLQKNDIILDFFSGSATTAEAVIKANSNFDDNIKFILVQLQENIDVMLNSSSANAKRVAENAISVLDELRKPHLLTELAKERIRRAGRKVKEEAGLNGQDLDIGFRVFRVDTSNMEDVYFAPKSYSQDKLDMFLDNVKADRTDLDLLFGAMLDWGVQLSLPMRSYEVVKSCSCEEGSESSKLQNSTTVYVVNEGDLVACFAEDITEEVIEFITDQSPLRVLLRDSCFSSDADKINIFEQFKQRLGWSDEEAYKNIRVI